MEGGGQPSDGKNFDLHPPPPGREFWSDGKSRQGSTPLAKICQFQHWVQLMHHAGEENV